MPHDDVDAVRALAATYRQLAEELRAAGQQAQAAMSQLPGAWTGDAATAATHPAGILASDVDLACRGLIESADGLQRCADQLRRAHEKHSWSLGKVLKLGAVVVVSGAAVVLSVGAAAPEVAATDSALISGEVLTAGTAVAEATTARAGADVALQASSRLLAAVRGMAAFVRPQLPYAVAFTGSEAGAQIADSGTVDPKRLAATFGMSLAVPPTMAATRMAIRSLPVLAERPAAGLVVGHLAAGGVVTTFDGTRQQVLTGRVDLGQAAHAGISGAVLSSGGDVVQRLPRSWRPGVLGGIVPIQPGATASRVPRQTLDAAMRDGIDLSAHEGPTLGHAVLKHVGRPVSYLQYRLSTESGSMRSTFSNQTTAERAITATLRAHKEELLEFENGQLPQVRAMQVTFDEPLGTVLMRDGTIIAGRSCRVVVRRDAGGGFVMTAYVNP